MNLIVTNVIGAKHVEVRLTPSEIQERGIKTARPANLIVRDTGRPDVLVAIAYRCNNGDVRAKWYADYTLSALHDLIPAICEAVPV